MDILRAKFPVPKYQSTASWALDNARQNMCVIRIIYLFTLYFGNTKGGFLSKEAIIGLYFAVP